MFERLFQWTAHRGAQIFCGVAIALLSLASLVNLSSPVAESSIIGGLWIGLGGAILPLVVVMAIARFRPRN